MTNVLDHRSPSAGYALDALATKISGHVHHPGTPGYVAAATPWNVVVPNAPVAVVEVATADDVAVAVRHAAAHGLQVSVQATGHGAVAYPAATLQIATSALRELRVSHDGAVRAGAGIRWQDVLEASVPLGFAPLTGSAPGVGVVGLLTGGGVGPIARSHGVSSDYVTAFDVVTGDGEIRRATATENPDLFWGLRGGKGSLGVVTAVEFATVALTDLVGGCLFFDGADAAAVLHTWREWTAGLSDHATTSLAIMRLPAMPGVPEPLAGKVAVAVRYAWTGAADEGLRVFAPMQTAGRVVFGGVGPMPYAAIGSIHNDPVDPMPIYDQSTVLRALTPETVEALVALTGPDASCPQVIVEVRHLGGAVARALGGPSAVSHRDAAFTMQTIGIAAPPLIDAVRAHAQAVAAAVAPWTDGSCLPNFQASLDPAQLARKYDAATLTRLAELAQRYDPAGVLAFAHGIRAAGALAR